MFVNPGFEGLKIVSARKDGGREGCCCFKGVYVGIYCVLSIICVLYMYLLLCIVYYVLVFFFPRGWGESSKDTLWPVPQDSVGFLPTKPTHPLFSLSSPHGTAVRHYIAGRGLSCFTALPPMFEFGFLSASILS